MDKAILIFKDIIGERKEEDIMEGRDVMLYKFISLQTPGEWYKIKELTTMFRQEIDFDMEEEHWLNYYWMGKALKRLNLIKGKKRMEEGREVILNVDKAKQKMEMFK